MTIKEALTLADAKDKEPFMQFVSSAISPKPWEHDANERREYCTLCGKSFFGNTKEMYASECSAIPRLTDAPEVLARKLRDEATQQTAWPNASTLCQGIAALQDIRTGKTVLDSRRDIDEWFAYWATPEQQIICCLLALHPEAFDKETI